MLSKRVEQTVVGCTGHLYQFFVLLLQVEFIDCRLSGGQWGSEVVHVQIVTSGKIFCFYSVIIRR